MTPVCCSRRRANWHIISMPDVRAPIAYLRPMSVRTRYHANDTSRDLLDHDPHVMTICDARAATDPPRLDREGFALIAHKSRVSDFTQDADLYREEIIALVRAQSGADAVAVTSPGVLRFSERDTQSGRLNNSRPARFAHVDINDPTAAAFADHPAPADRTIRRFAHFNVWRVMSLPPQDVPLALCDARSVAAGDLFEADAVFDEPGKPEWSFVGLVLAHSPAHRWHWFNDMTHDEVIMFTTNDSDRAAPHCVPHVAFDNPACPADATPRSSIEMRAVAYWYA